MHSSQFLKAYFISPQKARKAWRIILCRKQQRLFTVFRSTRSQVRFLYPFIKRQLLYRKLLVYTKDLIMHEVIIRPDRYWKVSWLLWKREPGDSPSPVVWQPSMRS